MRILFIAVLVALLASSALAMEPQLLTGGAAATGSGTNYVFTVTYKGNTTASDVSVVINGASTPMQELDPQDTILTDGKVYYVEASLDSGVNTYSFKCTDVLGASNTTAAKMLIVKEVSPFGFTHLDVMFSVLIFVPFVIYFTYLARKVTKTLERIDKRQEIIENKNGNK
ncbi:MAG: hypothetical protein KKH41_05140 [Candidatus Thermoplasmatota archaeon]|nr:hypothetical protein [Euryarchaeota archaeon]MBU4032485.1 hypothetical protein [Candidatus Thermoplasmatota archaeon]MBU4072127.1 hypothetical protein [Candidatus Thermoplasmatota archaeon]MBU4143539.1 hypothetical protein [Candidatus Thermoplasmatota archaeon]MBU4591952.1 hypothetical protein [Candidatus Thermoplasmatota archaeon]